MRFDRPAAGRDQVFDLLRIVFSVLVLLSHAAELTDGDRSRELFGRLTHSAMSFGELGVDGFFLLSGYLIVKSWERDPELGNYLRKRLLRIVPGYVVAFVLSVLAVGLLAPAIPHFFLHLGWRLPYSLLLLGYPLTPPVLNGLPYPLVNNSLWTISYEFRCYLLVALAGLCGVYRRPKLWLGATVLLLVAMAAPSAEARIPWSPHLIFVLGDPVIDVRLTAVYFVGVCFYLFRNRIAYRPALLGLGLIALAAVDILDHSHKSHLEIALTVVGAYSMFYLAQSKAGSRIRIRHLPDISYGIYLYGWPVEELWIYYRHGSPWVTFAVATFLCAALGWLSWHFVERPMLRFKRHATAALPPP